jgi:hypothetical protein
MTEPKDWLEWARACADDPHSPSKLTRDHLGMLTGQDKRALGAVAACWELYASSDEAGQHAAIYAIRMLLVGMQPKCWFFIRELIPYALDWGDRDRLFALIDIPKGV